MLDFKVETSQITKITENLRHIKNAKDYVSEYIIKPERVEAGLNEIKQLMTNRIESLLKNIKGLLNFYNFREAEKML